MMVLGIVGGIGAGKTTVVSLLSSVKKTYVIGADEIGHQLLLKNGKAYKKVVDTFGKEILDKEGNIVRFKLGAIVFGDKDKLQILNSISHPLIFEEVAKQIAKQKSKKAYEWILIDAALLIEVGLAPLTNQVIGVYAEKEIRIKRIMERDGFNREEALKRINSQKKWEELRSASSVVIDNSFSIEHTKDQITKETINW